MLTNKQILGKKGEELAAKHLRQKGYNIVERNYRFGKGEIDIICQSDDDLIIVEVKSVRVKGFGSGEERITPRKQKILIDTTYAFLDQNNQYQDFGVRFDVVVVNFFHYPAEILHYEGTFWQE
ncbi:YraN family protein [Calditrichota bacterium]